MSLYAVGRSSGFVFDNSETSVDFLCVEDSYIDQKLVKSNKNNIMTVYKNNHKEVELQ